MIKIQDLQQGDLVRIINQGTETEGRVANISRDQNMACIDNGVQEFWYSMEQLAPIPLTEEELLKLGFEKIGAEGGAKFGKGPFRVLVKDPGNYTNIEIWYREDHRNFNHPLYVHELQNHHLSMTKVPLEKGVLH